MRIIAASLVFILLLGIGINYNLPVATPGERSVLTAISRNLLDRQIADTCLPVRTTKHAFNAGTYGFAEGGLRPDRRGLDRISEQARGRSVNLPLGVPANDRPNLVNLTIATVTECARPIQLSTPIFSSDFAFVSARIPSPESACCDMGEAFALRRAGDRWVISDKTTWRIGPVP
ncbi:hypothetical protein [Sphingomonas sp. IC081]|uniref:hypothetical protein n=1 Tax=Sphingomonas sp. IC081 TaxID=304378 RepID=UPI0011578B28|nr:hypothetical protein [Sphingomonas sp. IC081]